MNIRALRRHTRLFSRTILFAIMLQTSAATAPAVCAGMSSSPESTAHAGHFALVSEAEFGNETSCDCGPGEPAQSGEHETGSCTMAAHCVSSPAVVAGASVLDDSVSEARMLAHPCARPRLVALSHPTPPPRV